MGSINASVNVIILSCFTLITSFITLFYSKTLVEPMHILNCIMSNVMHKFLISLSIYFCLTCFGLYFNPSLEAVVQLRRGLSLLGMVTAPGR
jgi:hypothetical protein